MVERKNPDDGPAPDPGPHQPYLWEPISRFSDPSAILVHARREGLLAAIRWAGPVGGEFKYKINEVHDHFFIAQTLSVNMNGNRSFSNEVMYRIGEVFSVALVGAAGSVEARGELDLEKYKK